MADMDIQTTGTVAKQLGLDSWELRRLAERSGVELRRLGRYRVYSPQDVDALRRALADRQKN
jgi:DNA-binding transcriptional MerR regulator